MSTQTRRDKRKQNKKVFQQRTKGLIVFEAQYDCGCCYATMLFKSHESASNAFVRAGLQNGATIVDDAGVKHEKIDTFYGFWTVNSKTAKEARKTPLKILSEKVFE